MKNSLHEERKNSESEMANSEYSMYEYDEYESNNKEKDYGSINSRYSNDIVSNINKQKSKNFTSIDGPAEKSSILDLGKKESGFIAGTSEEPGLSLMNSKYITQRSDTDDDNGEYFQTLSYTQTGENYETVNTNTNNGEVKINSKINDVISNEDGYESDNYEYYFDKDHNDPI